MKYLDMQKISRQRFFVTDWLSRITSSRQSATNQPSETISYSTSKFQIFVKFSKFVANCILRLKILLVDGVRRDCEFFQNFSPKILTSFSFWQKISVLSVCEKFQNLSRTRVWLAVVNLRFVYAFGYEVKIGYFWARSGR